MSILEKLFKLRQNNTTTGRELRAGTVTFITMSYIIFVQPVVLQNAGMNKGAVMVATCISSALAMVIMALSSNYPIALAPAMGHNFFFAFTVCGPLAAKGMGLSWQAALAANMVAGVIFLLLSLAKLQDHILRAVPGSLKHAMAVGIGLLITFVGLQWSGIIVRNPGTMVSLGNLGTPSTLLSILGLFFIAGLMALNVRGAILIGILATALCGLGSTYILKVDLVKYHGIVSSIPDVSPTFLKLSFSSLAKGGVASIVTAVLVFLFLDLFDTMGTLVGLAHQAGFIKEDGTIEKSRQVFISDAIGTIGGTILGTSTITSYIESGAGIAEGGRTGLATLFTAVFFLLALFFSPLVEMVGEGIDGGQGIMLYPVIAPVLILVGCLMMKSLKEIEWQEPVIAIPSFLTMVLMPLTFSITEGISAGFISLSILGIVSRRVKLPVIFHVFSLAFLMRYLFLV